MRKNLVAAIINVTLYIIGMIPPFLFNNYIDSIPNPAKTYAIFFVMFYTFTILFLSLKATKWLMEGQNETKKYNRQRKLRT